MFVPVCYFERSVSHILNGWRDDHGRTNVATMVKKRSNDSYNTVAAEYTLFPSRPRDTFNLLELTGTVLSTV